ncbi:cytochrome c oxidase assembly factor 7 homolog [Temnothorax curvispinosus]|uniref:Cytochrome c oxidase assembly factor 7 homolog n=1 Tax=Temnothorax curvispinosus TaxID=300111 RepID=A0A6J1R207_9HYME|nr:cytochrome c oxidase assembly factor 7 homolog [Temnothorax curvispinosus]
MAYDLKKEEDVKEYLKNLHIEYQFGCYSEKKPEVCHLLGDYYEAVNADMAKAASLYKTTCDQYNYARSCAKFGDFKAIGKGCKKDLPTAYKYMSKSCELNDESGCLHAGVLGTSKNDVGEKDRATQVQAGVRYLKKACDVYNSDKACFYLSGIYLGGIEDVIEKNYKEAYKLSLKSCEHGNPYACANLSQMHARGEGAQKNPELAATFKKRAIDLHEELKRVQPELKFHQGVNP